MDEACQTITAIAGLCVTLPLRTGQLLRALPMPLHNMQDFCPGIVNMYDNDWHADITGRSAPTGYLQKNERASRRVMAFTFLTI